MNSSVVSFSLNVLLKLSHSGAGPTPEFGTFHTWNFDNDTLKANERHEMSLLKNM